ncbi:MAG: hypothetical protein Q4A75_01505 [Peptostreptococcaceae bacterium]|nr:hypothetical protein [Peptostreptococcaceae bacterium]
MIEEIIKKHLEKKLQVKVLFEKPEPDKEAYILVEKVGSSKKNYLPSATFAFQSYGKTLFEAAELNERLKEAVESMIELDEIRGIRFEGDHNFTDTDTKKYRYQAVFEIKY